MSVYTFFSRSTFLKQNFISFVVYALLKESAILYVICCMFCFVRINKQLYLSLQTLSRYTITEVFLSGYTNTRIIFFVGTFPKGKSVNCYKLDDFYPGVVQGCVAGGVPIPH